jgi:hypothetical protein
MVENLREKRASELPTSITIIIMDSNNIFFFIKVAIVRKEINHELGKQYYDIDREKLRELIQ